MVKASTWVDAGKAMGPTSKAYAYLGPLGSFIVTWLVILILTTIGAAAMGWKRSRFVAAFTVIFILTWMCWVIGHNAYIAATDPQKAGVPWSLRMTGEAGYIDPWTDHWKFL